MSEPTVSVIIPVFNRECLIIETLDSISRQKFEDWECLLIDDHSMDATWQVVTKYISDKPRFKLMKRPDSYMKGAPSCRNYGLSLAKGEYVIFFDSDDLMTSDHVQLKCHKALEYELDMVVMKTKEYESEEQSFDSYYSFSDSDINEFNYVSQKINWLTYDTLIKTNIAKRAFFNERLRSGQEFNFYCQLLTQPLKVMKFDHYVTLRRMHDDSIQSNLRRSPKQISINRFMTLWMTYVDVEQTATKETRKYLTIKSCYFILGAKEVWPEYLISVFQKVFKEHSLAATCLIPFNFIKFFLNRCMGNF